MLPEMKRVNAIWNHPLYQKNLKELQKLEKDRIFCRHTPEHFFDVARLTWIYTLELFTVQHFFTTSDEQNSTPREPPTMLQAPELRRLF